MTFANRATAGQKKVYHRSQNPFNETQNSLMRSEIQSQGKLKYNALSYTILQYKLIGHFYVDIPTPSLHGNNSETRAKTVNIKMPYRFIIYFIYDSHSLFGSFVYLIVLRTIFAFESSARILFF